MKPKTWVQFPNRQSLLSNRDYIESNILIFFPLRQIAFNISLFDSRHGQRVSGFILFKDVQKIRFVRPQASALVFFAISAYFEDKTILTWFGGSHLRACAAVQGWQYGTVPSEFAYYVPLTLNGTVPA